MEKAVMFLPSLLVLVVGIQVSYACTCKPRTFDEAISDADAVLSAIVDEGVLLDDMGGPVFLDSMGVATRYEMYIRTLYKRGSKNLLVKGDLYFDAVLPRQEEHCGAVLMTGKKYLLSGNVTKEGTIYINKCELISLLDEGEDNESDDIDDLETIESQDINDINQCELSPFDEEDDEYDECQHHSKWKYKNNKQRNVTKEDIIDINNCELISPFDEKTDEKDDDIDDL